ncbi:hypothetical protein XHV734_3531 [Xanthomonas hortorum pv. vitians]|nr:hypothetical protein XHV734_3531 [Xanthomonas hortorum pv. vitians]
MGPGVAGAVRRTRQPRGTAAGCLVLEYRRPAGSRPRHRRRADGVGDDRPRAPGQPALAVSRRVGAGRRTPVVGAATVVRALAGALRQAQLIGYVRHARMRHRAQADPAHEVSRFRGNVSVRCGRLHASRRGTRRKYVHVGSYAASMPRKVPRRDACKHLRRLSVADRTALPG